MIMAWSEREGGLNFVFCDNGRVVDEKEKDGDQDDKDVEDTSGNENAVVGLA
jgi:hypothetical protein